MKFSRRTYILFATSALTLPALSGVAMAQSYPERPVRVIVSLGAGTGPDIVARLLMLWTAPPPARECHRCGCC
jgi:tripartite-type tricarboxylate transporter receptor subunit TctC